MSKTPSGPNVSKILAVVPSGKEFRFCTAEGIYTKVEANSLEDFAQKLDGIDAVSIQFHYPRGDFQAWIKDTIRDNELADKMCFVKEGLSGEELRQTLQIIVQKRIGELKGKK
jgi:hypothetical protein